jgi:2-polyprenyl-3-methyl-5-hydroxy-6-metoxy-1,4-benzoquinol methylase
MTSSASPPNLRGAAGVVPANSSAQTVLANLPHFAEWGGGAWHGFLKDALEHFIGSDLSGQRVLDIGARYGRTASMFALLGAHVTAVDTDPACIVRARAETARWGVAERVELLQSTGELDIVPDDSFDLVFTKSVLIIVPRLEHFLEQVRAKLRANGKIVFIENARGLLPFHLLRLLKRETRARWSRTRYFARPEFAALRRIFRDVEIRTSFYPPVALVTGYKP